MADKTADQESAETKSNLYQTNVIHNPGLSDADGKPVEQDDKAREHRDTEKQDEEPHEQKDVSSY